MTLFKNYENQKKNHVKAQNQLEELNKKHHSLKVELSPALDNLRKVERKILTLQNTLDKATSDAVDKKNELKQIELLLENSKPRLSKKQSFIIELKSKIEALEKELDTEIVESSQEEQLNIAKAIEELKTLKVNLRKNDKKLVKIIKQRNKTKIELENQFRHLEEAKSQAASPQLSNRFSSPNFLIFGHICAKRLILAYFGDQ